jgi:copper(I)-binding protein
LKKLLAVMAFVLAACGQGGSSLTVTDAQYRPPLGATGIGVAYFSVRSETADRIIGVSSPEAASIEMHGSVSNGVQTVMKRMESVDLPAGQTVTFGPKGMHLMVFGPKPLAEGATFPIQIELQSGRSETVAFHHALMGQ